MKVRKATIQAKVGDFPNTPAASTTPAPTVGTVSLEVAPGTLLHSSQVDRTVVQDMLASGGVNPGETEHMTQILVNMLNLLDTTFVAPPPAAAAPSTQPMSQEPVIIADDKKPDVEAKRQTEEMELEFTDGSTDSEAEAEAATANVTHTKTKKRVSKKDRDVKNGKGGPGKGSTKDLVKSADKDKAKK